MARQDPGEPFYRVDSNEAFQILEKEKDGALAVTFAETMSGYRAT